MAIFNASRTESDWVWLDEQPVAQFTDSYDAAGTYQGTTVTYLYADHLGTPRIGTDASKAITWRYQSDAFGVGTPSGTASVRLRLPGQIDLGILGIGYNYFRDYDPQVGRYLEGDPIGLEGGLNTYTYVGNNPLSAVDWLGLAASCGDDRDCVALCLKAYYGDFYTFALAASPLSFTGFALDEVAEATETNLSRQANRALYGLSTRSYEKGKRLLRTLKQFRGFNAANQVLGAGALGFVVGAQGYCRFQCQSE
ncbi:MAG: hypothetical protein AMXMBFR45_02950 [Gammaproteobacteria bacterium]